MCGTHSSLKGCVNIVPAAAGCQTWESRNFYNMNVLCLAFWKYFNCTRIYILEHAHHGDHGQQATGQSYEGYDGYEVTMKIYRHV